MTTIDYLARQARLREQAQQAEADFVVLVPGANMVYFTGLHVHQSERPTLALVGAEGGISFIVPKLEASKLDALNFDPLTVFAWADDEGYAGAFRAATDVLGLGAARLGVDDHTMRLFEWLAFKAAAPDVQVVPLGEVLLNLRAIKSKAEVELIRRAVALSEAALSQTIDGLRSGATEREIAETLSAMLQSNGSHGHAFSPLVLIGANSALPHGSVGERELQAGDLLLFDFGGTLDGYPADITRTFVYGLPSDEVRAIYDAVYRANAAAREAVRPGVTGAELDRAARDVIEAAGYGEYFVHRTGHGLGLEVHELPNIAAGNDQPLVPGMVFTIEPGVYVPGVGGVRIEDNILVTAEGGESITQYPRALTSI